MKLNILHRSETDFGDHGEFVYEAVELTDGETIEELIKRTLLGEASYRPVRYGDSIEIRIIKLAPVQHEFECDNDYGIYTQCTWTDENGVRCSEREVTSIHGYNTPEQPKLEERPADRDEGGPLDGPDIFPEF